MHALREAARRARGGQVVGVDISELMVRLARKRNARAIARGEVDVRVADAATLALDGVRFDRIFSVHSIYFWRDRGGVLARLAAALAPGGVLLLAFRPEGEDIPARFRDATYRFPVLAEIETALRQFGLEVRTRAQSGAVTGVVLLTASKL